MVEMIQILPSCHSTGLRAENDEVDADGLVLDEHVEEEEDLEVKAEGDTVDLSKRRKRRK
jgi:hypothetical protein